MQRSAHLVIIHERDVEEVIQADQERSPVLVPVLQRRYVRLRARDSTAVSLAPAISSCACTGTSRQGTAAR